MFKVIKPGKSSPGEILLALAAPSGKLNRKARKRLLRYGLIGGNVVLLLTVGIFVLTNRSTSQTVKASTLSGATATAASAPNPVDTLSSAQIALTAAQLTNLPELTAIHNQADSDSLTLAVVPNDTSTLAKPQIVSASGKSKADIIHYTTHPGDTVDSLSAKFGVSSDSIKWSNNISSDSLTANLNLVIPPFNGIVYTVKSGDTPASLAGRYQADESLIIEINDAELSGLQPGEQIVIPNGKVAPVTLSYHSYSSGSYGAFAASYGGNGYDYGWCTYYVASRVSMPTNWGNANTWDNYARLSGWIVASSPPAWRPGIIAQTDAGWGGHVAYVEAVSADGSMIKYSDMNGIAGWGRVGYSDWVPASTFEHYIYH